MRTLVVDDEVVIAQLHRAFVDATPGFDVVGLAHTGAQALDAARELRVELVLLDIHLPDTTGLEVLRALREEGALPGGRAGPVDVFAITAVREAETVRWALAGGVVDYLVKPFTAADLRARLTSYLQRRAVLTADAAPGARPGLDQDAVDRARAGAGRTEVTGAVPLAPPKGLSAVTLALVTEALDAAGGEVSASELAQRVGLSRVSARRYLEHLVRRGEAAVTPRYGRAGRPEHGYRSVRRADAR